MVGWSSGYFGFFFFFIRFFYLKMMCPLPLSPQPGGCCSLSAAVEPTCAVEAVSFVPAGCRAQISSNLPESARLRFHSKLGCRAGLILSSIGASPVAPSARITGAAGTAARVRAGSRLEQRRT